MRHGRKVKIAAVTASAFKVQQRETFDAGMDDFVRKPYRFNEIYECMARQLGIKYLHHSDAFAEEAALVTLPAALRLALRNALASERIAAAFRQTGGIVAALGHLLFRMARYFD